MADEKVLEHSFHFPVGVKEVRYLTPEDREEWFDPEDSEEYEFDSEDFSGADNEDESDDLYSDDGPPLPPDSIVIVSQEVRTLPGGGQVVDVTLEMPELSDGQQYDMRVTKV